MTQPIKITREEIKKWILEQSDDKSINYTITQTSEIESEDCGCLMIEYAKDKNIPVVDVGIASFNGKRPHPAAHIPQLAIAEGWCYNSWGSYHTTFQTLKEMVLQEG